MCDYSLMSFPNRLAIEGEDLVSHKFETGTMGFACAADLQAKMETQRARPKTLWSALKAIVSPPEEKSVPAVCVPPGAQLLLMDISEQLRNEIGVGRVEEVTFEQITAAANSYRDGVRFRNGREILLQRLEDGQRVRVLALALQTQSERIVTGEQHEHVQHR